jgi:hypothetical protein
MIEIKYYYLSSTKFKHFSHQIVAQSILHFYVLGRSGMLINKPDLNLENKVSDDATIANFGFT